MLKIVSLDPWEAGMTKIWGAILAINANLLEMILFAHIQLNQVCVDDPLMSYQNNQL